MQIRMNTLEHKLKEKARQVAGFLEDLQTLLGGGFGQPEIPIGQWISAKGNAGYV